MINVQPPTPPVTRTYASSTLAFFGDSPPVSLSPSPSAFLFPFDPPPSSLAFLRTSELRSVAFFLASSILEDEAPPAAPRRPLGPKRLSLRLMGGPRRSFSCRRMVSYPNWTRLTWGGNMAADGKDMRCRRG